MTRPSSIRLFDLFYLGSLALTLIGALLVWPELVGQAAARAQAARLSAGALNGIVVGGLAVATLITLLLWFFVSRRRSVVAKWLVVLFAVYTVFETTTSMQAGATWGSVSGALSLAAMVAQVVAAALLFTAGARAWFAGEPEYDA